MKRISSTSKDDIIRMKQRLCKKENTDCYKLEHHPTRKQRKCVEYVQSKDTIYSDKRAYLSDKLKHCTCNSISKEKFQYPILKDGISHSASSGIYKTILRNESHIYANKKCCQNI